MEYTDIAWFEMKPDLYGGPKCDETIPMWYGYCSGDKEGETLPGDIIFDPKVFPPGTKIVVSSPTCPKCEEIYENCMVRGNDGCSCDFDWSAWVAQKYS